MANGSKAEADGPPANRAEPRKEQLGPKRLKALPPELVELDETHMVTNDTRPRSSDDLRSSSSYAPTIADTSPQSERFRSHINEIRSLANDLYAAVVKEKLPRLPEITTEVENSTHRAREPVSAMDIVRTVGPILKFRSHEANSDLVEKILAIQDVTARYETVRATLPYFGSISKNDQSVLVKNAVSEALENGVCSLTRKNITTPEELERLEAVRFIVEANARGYLPKELQSDISYFRERWTKLDRLMQNHERFCQKSLSIKVQTIGPEKTADHALRTNNPSKYDVRDELIHIRDTLMPHADKIGTVIRSELMERVIDVFSDDHMEYFVDQGGTEWQETDLANAKIAADIIAYAYEKGYQSTQASEHKLNEVQDEELKAILNKSTENAKKYLIHSWDDTEIAKLRARFDEDKKEESDGNVAEHQRLNILGKIAQSLAQAESLVRLPRQEVINAVPNRSRERGR